MHKTPDCSPPTFAKHAKICQASASITIKHLSHLTYGRINVANCYAKDKQGIQHSDFPLVPIAFPWLGHFTAR